MKKILIIIFLIIAFFSFWKINEQNYAKYREIKKETVDHPENLPKEEIAKITSFWYTNIKADYYWLNTIQYIWGNAFYSEYKKYLYEITDLVTSLNPFFEYPYVISQLLLPEYNPRYENLNEDEQNRNIDQAIALWLKWVENFCDDEKIKKIENTETLEEIWNNPKLQDVCNWYKIPYYLAYNYYHHLNDAKKSAKYYKIAANSKESLEWAKTMAAIMQWKWGQRQKSYFMFINLAQSSNPENEEICKFLSDEMYNLWIWIFINNEVELNSQIIKAVENLTQEWIWEFKDLEWINKNECYKNIYKASRELNLKYIEDANEKYFNDNWRNAQNQQELFNSWYIDYIAKDYQQYEDYWIEYFYNEKLWAFDYEIKSKN